MGATSEKLAMLSSSKADIKSALSEMGRAPSDVLSSYGNEIRSIKTEEQINNAKIVDVIAQDQIKIGDTVYTVENSGSIYIRPGAGEYVGVASFSPDGRTLVLGGMFPGYAAVYSVSGVSITYVCDICADKSGAALNGCVESVTFSPDSAALVICGRFDGHAKVYSASESTITYVSDIYADGGSSELNGDVYTSSISPDGTLLVLGGVFDGYAKTYSVSGTTITYAGDVSLDGAVYASSFSPNGSVLVLGGVCNGYARVYSVSGTTVTFVSSIFDSLTADIVRYAAFSSDGTMLVLCGKFTGARKVKVFSVSGTTFTDLGTIYAYADSQASFDGDVYTAAFSPDGTTLVIGGDFSGYAKVYAVYETNVTFVRDISLDNYTLAAAFNPYGSVIVFGGAFTGLSTFFRTEESTFLGYVDNLINSSAGAGLSSWTAAFSPDGTTIVVGIDSDGYAKVCSVSGATVTYISNIPSVNSSVYTAAFSPDGTTLVLGGYFSGYAKVYRASGTTITYVSDIYADTGTTALGSYVNSVAFSPDGTTLVLGGHTGYAKAYRVSGTTITYVCDIPTDSETVTWTTEVSRVAFSPDGTTLILSGSFPGYAKIYSVSGTTITYVDDIYSDAGTTPFRHGVGAITFSPDGTMIVLCESMSYAVRVYSVSGTAITFIGCIYADADETPFDSTVADVAFSPDGTMLVLCGAFTGSAKRYSVSETTIRYIEDIYRDGYSLKPTSRTRVSFSPQGDIVVFTGPFDAYGYVYEITSCLTPAYGTYGYLAPSGSITPPMSGTGVGFSKSDIAQGETGSVKLIGNIDLESWAGNLTFSGAYATPNYYTRSGCSLSVDKQSGMAFITIQGGVSTSYENVLFDTAATLPNGVAMLAPQTLTNSSGSAQRYYTCVLTGITGKINVGVNFRSINSTYDYVLATLTVSYA